MPERFKVELKPHEWIDLLCDAFRDLETLVFGLPEVSFCATDSKGNPVALRMSLSTIHLPDRLFVGSIIIDGRDTIVNVHITDDGIIAVLPERKCLCRKPSPVRSPLQ